MSTYKGKKRRGRGGKRYNNNYRTNFTYGQVVDKVVNDVARLKGLINVEFKKVDTQNVSDITTAEQLRLINGMALGDDISSREGQSVRIKSVQIALTLFLNPLSINTFVRCILFINKQPNQTLPVIGDLLADGGNIGSTNFRNLNNRKRFVILKDEVIMLQGSGERTKHLEYYKKMDMIEIFDDTSTGGIADITTNALYLILYSGEAVNGVIQNCRTRIRFIDN